MLVADYSNTRNERLTGGKMRFGKTTILFQRLFQHSRHIRGKPWTATYGRQTSLGLATG